MSSQSWIVVRFLCPYLRLNFYLITFLLLYLYFIIFLTLYSRQKIILMLMMIEGEKQGIYKVQINAKIKMSVLILYKAHTKYLLWLLYEYHKYIGIIYLLTIFIKNNKTILNRILRVTPQKIKEWSCTINKDTLFLINNVTWNYFHVFMTDFMFNIT